MFAIVKNLNGIPDIGTAYLVLGISISDNETVVEVDGIIKGEYQELTEEEYRKYVPKTPTPLNVPSNTEVLQSMNDLRAELEIAGVIG